MLVKNPKNYESASALIFLTNKLYVPYFPPLKMQVKPLEVIPGITLRIYEIVLSDFMSKHSYQVSSSS